ncbi:MAG: O-antigen ligase family protein [Prevotella sp.]|nr:O-antigen ligase family protein [Prevotella sp.]
MKLAYNSAKSNYTGGRVAILFLLFALAIYEFIHAGFTTFAIVCIMPVMVLVAIIAFSRGVLVFWTLLVVNYIIQWHSLPPLPVPTSIPNEMLEILLIAMAAIDVKDAKFERSANLMMFALLVWSAYVTLEVLNDTCGLGIQVGAWFSGARMMAFQLLYAHLIFILYIRDPKMLMKYLYFWGALAIFAAFWVWKQQKIGLTPGENAFLQGRGRTTHIINGGATIRLFSIYGDAANFGIGTAATAVAFLIFALTAKVRKYKIYFLIVGLIATWAMFPSGTRTATFCLFAGFAVYVFLSKSVKIAVPVSIGFALIYFILAYTTIGNGNAQIRRMRSGFNKNDASANQRTINQAVMKKYLADAPWGIGLGMGYENVPANNKFRKLAIIPPDSEYVFIWIRTGYVGITLFVIITLVIFCGASSIVLFRLRSPSLRGIGAGLTCAFASIQLGGYANQVLMQFPNCLVFWGGISLVYILPHIEDEWIKHEEEQLAIEAEKKRIKEEKKRAKRV